MRAQRAIGTTHSVPSPYCSDNFLIEPYRLCGHSCFWDEIDQGANRMAIDNYPRQSIKDINTNAFAQALIAWWQLERRSFPWRKKMPLWKALLTEVMLQRTRADQVSKSFRNLDSEYRVASQLSTMSVQDATRQRAMEQSE